MRMVICTTWEFVSRDSTVIMKNKDAREKVIIFLIQTGGGGHVLLSLYRQSFTEETFSYDEHLKS